MTSPKNTPQDERDAHEYAFSAITTEPISETGELHNRLPFTAEYRAFLAGRLGYVPNQTVVEIAEAARIEERERIALILENHASSIPREAVKAIFNPPEAE